MSRNIWKSLFAVGFIFLYAGELEAVETSPNNTSLEKLWELVVFENTEVRTAIRDRELSDYDFSHYWQRFLPSVFVSSSSTFSDISIENSEVPEALNSSITISESLPGGLSIEVSPNVSFSRELVEEKTKLIEETKVSLSLSQKLLPYWAQKCGQNPEKTIQQNNNKQAAVNSKIVFLSAIEDITGKYFQYRSYCRNIDSVEKRITLLQEELDTLKKMNLVGNASLIEVFSIEEELKKYMNERQSYNSSKESTFFMINNCFSIKEHNHPKSQSYNNIQELLLPEKELPEKIEPVFLENPTYEYLKLQENNLEANLILNRQNSSPVLSLSGNVPVHNSYDEGTFYGAYQSSNAKKWSLSVSLNLTSLVSDSKKRILKEYENDKQTNKEKMDALVNSLSAEREMYETLLADSKKQLELLRKSLEYYQSLLEAEKVLYTNGKITLFEIHQTEVEIACKKNDIQNCEDNIWYYSWVIKNRVSGQARH